MFSFVSKFLHSLNKYSLHCACSVLILLSINSFSQSSYFAVYFKDKSVSAQVSQLSLFSEEAINRKIKNGVETDYYDFPINEYYLHCLYDDGFNILFTSKWLNCAIVVSNTETNTKQIQIISDKLSKYEFVTNVIYINTLYENDSLSPKNYDSFGKQIVQNRQNIAQSLSTCNQTYDFSYISQLAIVNGLPLHEMGYRGSGVRIAIMDDGFLCADQQLALRHLFEDQRIVYVRNFLDNNSVYDHGSGHGSCMLSVLAADVPEMRGSAPDADYLLFRTEDYFHESLLEEYAWVKAAELADSLGVDIISSSQNYTTMDNPAQSHSYSDMDGKTCPISIGAQIAASKGIIVVSSAGNDGALPWKYISAPADAPDVVTVGGVGCDSTYWFESSQGPTADGRIKPDICALSVLAVTINPIDGTLMRQSGTSYAAPVVAGFFACLMQAFPHVKSSELKSVVYNTSSLTSNPDNYYGRGIPNFAQAYSAVGINDFLIEKGSTPSVYPNPFTDSFCLSVPNSKFISFDAESISILTLDGHQLPFSIIKEESDNLVTNVKLFILSSYRGIVFIDVKCKQHFLITAIKM